MHARIVFTLTATALAAVAAAQPATQSSSDPKTQNERMICRSMPDRGSRFVTERVCHTRAEWAELRRQTRDAIDHIQMSRAGSAQ